MGIYNFWTWFNNNFKGCINKLSDGHDFNTININIDNLLIDMNGLFHNSTQKIYEYGNCKPKIQKYKKNASDTRLQLKVFEDICQNIEILVKLTNPKKRIVLCVDGPAPFAKQIQMRRRRFKTAINREEDDISFDSNAISPGTKFMDYLTKYIDFFIRKKISEDPKWKSLEIIFSNEKVPGEGESKIFSYIRKYGEKDESYCLHGLDADLIMLSLSLHKPKFYILREDMFDPLNKYFIVDIEKSVLQLSEIMRWESSKHIYNNKNAIDDFVFLSFMAGNDFLPHIPSIEILESGIEIIISIYRDIGREYGHLIESTKDNFIFNKDVLKIFFDVISEYEKPILEKKLKNKRIYFQDEILEKCATFDKDVIILDINKYRKEYNEKCFGKGEKQLKKICNDYLEGLQWVITYYKKGCSNWNYYYPYDYSPFASSLSKYILDFNVPIYKKTEPFTLYQQLISVLPPKSCNLLPYPLNNLLIKDDSPLKKYCPTEFEIDLSGKKREYQGIVKIPILNPTLISNTYTQNIKYIDQKDLKRNIIGKTYKYNYCSLESLSYKCFYGKIINCKAKIKPIFI